MNRTFKFYGLGFGAEPVTITVSADGNVIYQGTVATIDEPLPVGLFFDPERYVPLFEFQNSMYFVGGIAMTVTVNSGNGILLSYVEANYVLIPNPVYTQEQMAIVSDPAPSQEKTDIFTSLANPPLTQEEIDALSNPDTAKAQYRQILAQHDLSLSIPGGPGIFDSNFSMEDSRLNCLLDGNPISAPDPRPLGQSGDWTWSIPTNSTLSYSFNIETPGYD